MLSHEGIIDNEQASVAAKYATDRVYIGNEVFGVSHGTLSGLLHCWF